MGKRKTSADYHALAREKNISWLGTKAGPIKAKTRWKCQEGHEWEASYSSVNISKNCCPYCAGNARRTPQHFRELADKLGLEWQGPEVRNAITKTNWRCKKGHIWYSSFANTQSIETCPHCSREQLAKKQRLKSEDYHLLAENRGFLWLGPPVKRNSAKTWWLCSEGHEWESDYSHIQQGKGCPVCAGNQPITSEEYQKAAEESGIIWLGPAVSNTHTKTRWQCQEGHIWEAVYLSIKHQGSGCPKCASNFPKLPKDFTNLASEKGFVWLGPEVANVFSNTWWQCSLGHKWEATYNNIGNHNSGCPICRNNASSERQRTKPEEYHELAKERGFKWLGPAVRNNSEATEWECSLGHRWWTGLKVIARGNGCPYCSGVAKKTANDYHDLAEERNLVWLGPEVENVTIKTEWRCKNNHSWFSSYTNIQSGRSCPTCLDMVNGVQVSAPQRLLYEMVGGILNGSVGTYRADILLEVGGQSIAIEYDSWYWHATRLESDNVRDQEFNEMGIPVIRVRSNALVPSLEQIDEAISKILHGSMREEIILEDWGVGQIFEK